MAKDRQQFINDYATRAIQNGMDPSQAWAEAANMADRALALGHITGDELETQAAQDRAPAFKAPQSLEEMRNGAAKRAWTDTMKTGNPVLDTLEAPYREGIRQTLEPMQQPRVPYEEPRNLLDEK